MELFSLPVRDTNPSQYNKVLIEIYEPRKMKATWSIEMAQDLAAYHSIDAVAELEAILADELKKAIEDENRRS
jgi:glycine betaine/choline ABC-type transport system substrate-binding protein